MTAHPIGMPPRRPTVRRRLLVAALILLPVLELALLIEVGARIGAGATLLLLLAGVVAGSLVIRQVGVSAVARLRTASPDAASVPSGRSPAGTALVVVAGVLLALPGFLSDLAGLALLVPPVRRALVRRAGDAVLRRVRAGGVRVVRGQVLDDGAGPRVDVRIVDVGPAAGPGTSGIPDAPRSLPPG